MTFFISIPKSSNPGRIATNFDVLNWELSEEQMEQLRKLNTDGAIGVDDVRDARARMHVDRHVPEDGRRGAVHPRGHGSARALPASAQVLTPQPPLAPPMPLLTISGVVLAFALLSGGGVLGLLSLLRCRRGGANSKSDATAEAEPMRLQLQRTFLKGALLSRGPALAASHRRSSAW